MADEITEADVQAWVDDMVRGTLGRALAPKTAVDRHALLFAIFAHGLAPARRYVDRNPCVGTELPKRQKKAPKGLRPAEWAALHAALGQVNPPAADLALFLLASGWRWSEATALAAYDLEDYGNALFVTMGQVVRRNAAGQHVIVTEGKGEASLRRIQLDDEAAAMVRRRAATVPGNGLVFTTAGGAQWHYANFRRDAWNPAVKLANLDRVPSPHWLRHTAVVWLARSGASLAELQARIGHQNIGTTIGVYGRMLTDVSPVALEGFAALRGAGAKPLEPAPDASVGPA
jgi:integrase